MCYRACKTAFEVQRSLLSLSFFFVGGGGGVLICRHNEGKSDLDFKLVLTYCRHELVPDEELGSFYDLLIDDPPDVRRAIGALVYDHLIAQKFNNSQSISTGNYCFQMHQIF